ncbi:MAG: CotH kinase family protein [Flavobacteriales bacterium]|nr:CotH kinase family protein [Flavobacteriales bacterium]
MRPSIFTSICVLFLYQEPVAAQTVTLDSSNLPIVVINSSQTIVDEPKITADMGVIYNGPGVRNYTTDAFNNYNGKIGIEIRGNTAQDFPKKSYGFETRDAWGNNNNVPLLGMPPENDWILYAPYSDKSLMRNVLTFKLGNDMGRYASRTQFCELIVNGDYKGVYVLMEKIKIDPGRVAIEKLNESDLSGDPLTGGYIIKLDRNEGEAEEGWHSAYHPYIDVFEGYFFVYHYPKSSKILNVQQDYIQEFMYDFETALIGPDFKDPVKGYARYIDVESFIDFLISIELARNIDAYYISTYMYKDRDSKGGKVNMGPLWDFNLAYGNADYADGFKTDGWQYNIAYTLDGAVIPFWWCRLLQDTDFRTKLKTRWDDLRTGVLHKDSMMNYIDSLTAYLNESQQRNFVRWPVLGQVVWPNYYIGQTYQEEINLLKSWITDRLVWIDKNMPGDCIIPAYDEEEFFILAHPNPIGSSVNLDFWLYDPKNVTIKVYDVLGKKEEVLIDGAQEAGYYSLHWNSSEVSSGVYIYQVQIDGEVLFSDKLVKLVD